MARQAQRLEVVEMMRARQLRVLSGARHDVVDLEPPDLLRRAPRAHRREVRAVRRVLRSQRPFRAARAAPSAAIAVAPLHRRPRNRPPMIRPERVTACVTAPRSPARRQRRRAPSAHAGRRRRRQRTYGEQAVPLRHGIPCGRVNETTRPLRNVTVYWSIGASSYSHTPRASSWARVK